MTEPNTTHLFCRNCKTEIFRKAPRGRIPTQCADCRLADCRQRAREQHERKRAGYVLPTTYVCVSCKGAFPRPKPRGQIPLRCGPCWTGNEAERTRNRSAEETAELRRIFETEGRWSSCETCGEDIRCRSQKGPAQRFCDPCRTIRKRDTERAVRPWDWKGHCFECGGPDGRIGRDGRRIRCWTCLSAKRDANTGQWIQSIAPERRADAAKYGPSAVMLRGPWDRQYTNIDIFRRDRWKCQICLKPVDETLRNPSTLCATADHIIPRSQGGLDLRENVRLAHQSCNASRNNRGGNEQLVLVG